MDMFYYADLTRSSPLREGIAAGSWSIIAVGAIAFAVVAIGSLPAGLVSMQLAYALRKRKGLSRC